MHQEFKVHKLNEDGLVKARALAVHFDKLLGALEEMCPTGRELAIVRTKLEEACFFAKKAVANDPINQVKE